jgi:phosphatidylglycerophosphatase A
MKRTAMDRFVLFVATGCGLGLFAPFAPGTFGSLPGVALAYATTALPTFLEIPAVLGFTLLAIPFCDRVERLLGVRDDGRIAADEWMLFPLAVAGLPLSALPWWSMPIFFAVVRAVDILKPPPARALQSLPGGRGIVVDDFVANLYSLAVNWILYFVLFS